MNIHILSYAVHRDYCFFMKFFLSRFYFCGFNFPTFTLWKIFSPHRIGQNALLFVGMQGNSSCTSKNTLKEFNSILISTERIANYVCAVCLHADSVDHCQHSINTVCVYVYGWVFKILEQNCAKIRFSSKISNYIFTDQF